MTRCLIFLELFLVHVFSIHELFLLGFLEGLLFLDGGVFYFSDFRSDLVLVLEWWWDWRRIVVSVVLKICF
jgi:hypothetical protein